MGRQRLGGADNQLRMCRVLSHLSSLQKHLSIHTQLTPTRFSTSTFFFLLALFPSFFHILFSLPGCKGETDKRSSARGPLIIGDGQAAKDGGGSSRITSTAV